MRLETKIAPPSSVIFAMDFSVGRTPDTFGGKLIAATDSCVAVGTFSEQDGETTIVLTNDPVHEGPLNATLAFDGKIDVRSGSLSVVTALNESVLSLPVRVGGVRVRVWTNDPAEPSWITFEVD